MDILVCISKTPDTTAKIAFTSGNTKYNEEGVQFIMNPYDEWYALVKALEIKEAQGGNVVIINVGPSENDTIIRKGLAIGADEAVRVDADPKDPMFVAQQIANYAKSKSFGAIFLGKETIDFNGSEVGSILSEMMDWPFVSYASALEMSGDTAKITRDIEGGIEVCEIQGPFVLSAAKGLAEQRIPNMRGIMTAKTKSLEVLPASNVAETIKVVQFIVPPGKTHVKMVNPEDMNELVRLLHEEAKVI
ncbi:MAG: electron transfer flavoprotein subunit beta/FixA family protein [Saprospiraceae bacterium]